MIDPTQPNSSHVRQHTQLSLKQLEAQAKPLCRAYVKYSKKSLETGIELGGVLRQVKNRPELKRQWRAWCKQQGISVDKADQSILLYDNRQMLADRGARTIQTALKLVRSLDDTSSVLSERTGQANTNDRQAGKPSRHRIKTGRHAGETGTKVKQTGVDGWHQLGSVIVELDQIEKLGRESEPPRTPGEWAAWLDAVATVRDKYNQARWDAQG